MSEHDQIGTYGHQKDIIVDFLRRRLSITEEQSATLPADVWDALAADPKQGIPLALKALKRKEVKGGILKQHADNLRQKLQDVSTSTRTKVVEAMGNAERVPEGSEIQRVNAALEEAQSMGLVDIEDVGEAADQERRAIVIGSGHYSISGPIKDVEEGIKLAQYQMFMLASLLEKYKVESTLYVEGIPRGSVPHLQLQIRLPDGQQYGIQHKQCQKHFAQNPQYFMTLMDSLYKDGHRQPFYSMTSFAHLEGAHQPDIQSFVQEISDEYHIIPEYFARYRNYQDPVPKAFQQNERWYIRINNRTVDPSVLYQDSVKFIEIQEKIDRSSELREEEVVDIFQGVAQEKVPMAWVGLDHLSYIAERCEQRNVPVRVVRAAAHKNIPKKISSDIPTVTALRDFAASCIALNRQVSK